ncbi:unnamed protein product [Gordionus sp. m RMFG-2023]
MNWMKIYFIISIISLFHSAYSAAQYRKFIRLTEQEYTVLPFDIKLQAIISLIISCYTLSILVGEFKEVRLINDIENKNTESIITRPSFYLFNHRGQYLSTLYECNRTINKYALRDNTKALIFNIDYTP